MKRKQVNTSLWGIIVLLLGILGLLYNFGVLDPYLITAAYALAALLGLAGIAYLVLIVVQATRWELTIPGFGLLSLASVTYLATLGTFSPAWLGVIFVGGVVLGFLVLFLSNRSERWWALLMAGFISAMAAVAWAINQMMVPDSSSFSAYILGALLFGGFALSFLLLYLLVGDRRQFQWSLVMTGVFGAFALVLLSKGLGGGGNVLIKLWPLLLIVLGAFMLSRLITGRGARPAQPPAKPAASQQPASPDEAAVAAPEPARIVRPKESEPAALQDVEMNDPAAALDALLDASKKAADEG